MRRQGDRQGRHASFRRLCSIWSLGVATEKETGGEARWAAREVAFVTVSGGRRRERHLCRRRRAGQKVERRELGGNDLGLLGGRRLRVVLFQRKSLVAVGSRWKAEI